MRAKSFAGMNCSVAGAIEAVVDRWGFLIMRDLTLGLSRYDEFQTSMSIPAQTLATRLKDLEGAGLIERRRYQDNPPRDEYVLTPQGRDFGMILTALREWGDRWNAHGTDGPPLSLVDSRTGQSVRLAFVDSASGEVVAPNNVKPVPGPGADTAMMFRLKLPATK